MAHSDGARQPPTYAASMPTCRVQVVDIAGSTEANSLGGALLGSLHEREGPTLAAKVSWRRSWNCIAPPPPPVAVVTGEGGAPPSDAKAGGVKLRAPLEATPPGARPCRCGGRPRQSPSRTRQRHGGGTGSALGGRGSGGRDARRPPTPQPSSPPPLRTDSSPFSEVVDADADGAAHTSRRRSPGHCRPCGGARRLTRQSHRRCHKGGLQPVDGAKDVRVNDGGSPTGRPLRRLQMRRPAAAAAASGS